jgi:hypothetical protein
MSITTNFEKYLGLPAIIGQSRSLAFAGLKGRIWERMQGWKETFLSQAGKEVLLKAVVQAIPTYTMSVFQLPKTLCKDINSLMSKFWWGHKNDENKIAWMSWSKLGRTKERGGLGFRDLEWFNMALLAKQGWRLIQNPDSLAARILKEKYYPYGTFLDAQLGRQPSYVWRSFWNARVLLVEGLFWRVGDGQRISIWYDKWVPKAMGGYLQSPVRILDRNTKVSALLDRETNWWNVPLIHEIFSVEEAALICGMAVSPRSGVDRLIWHCNKNGEFSVRSAYYLAKDKFEVDNGSCSNRDSNKMMWKAIWKIEVPRATKSFLWKACNEILPTKGKLSQKHVTSDPLCPICCLETETTGHILWTCASAQDVWAECPRRIQKCHGEATDFMSIMEQLLSKCSTEEVQLAVLVARQIWHRRNSVVFSGSFKSPKEILQMAKDQLEVFNMVNQPISKEGPGTRRTTISLWTKPPPGVLKTNWDAAVDGKRRKIGVGVIVRNHEGGVIAMMCEIINFIQDPVTAEALAARRAVEFSRTLGVGELILEGDALQIVEALQSEDGGRSLYGVIIEDALQIMQSFLNCKVSFIHREGNEEAHKLAKLAISLGENKVWREDYPFSVQNDVTDD